MATKSSYAEGVVRMKDAKAKNMKVLFNDGNELLYGLIFAASLNESKSFVFRSDSPDLENKLSGISTELIERISIWGISQDAKTMIKEWHKKQMAEVTGNE